MTQTIALMTSEELAHVPRVDADAGFGCLVTARGALPLEAMDVTARVIGLVSHTELRQTFVNSHGEPIEATYIFPLPDRAAVTRFRMEVAGRVTEGVLEERGKARQQYDQAIAAGHRAAITEEERPGVFTLRVGNLMPGERAVIQLDMTGPVAIEETEATYRFPLVVAPRYIPGALLPGASVGDGVAADTDAVPDASRISPPVLLPGFPSPVRLSITLAVDPAGLVIGNLRSSLHTVVQEQRGNGHRLRVLPGERLDRDFIVRFSVGDAALRTSLVLAPDQVARPAGQAPGRDTGTFVLTLVPPVDAAAGNKPRDVIFVLDRSGSMDGWKMITARRAVARMVDTLNERDRFAVLAFDNRVEAPPSLGTGLCAASDRHRFRAVEFLAALEARGGTEMAQPLAMAADALAGGYADRQRILVLVTDGQVGNEDQILRTMSARLANVRVFTLGVDQAVNEGFLKRLAALGGGRCALVESEDRLDEVMGVIHQRIAPPVITELAVHGDGGLEIEPDTLVPQRLPDLVAGAPVVISGRYRGAGRLVVSGQRADGAPWRESAAAVTCQEREAAAAVAAVWARGAVRELEDRYVMRRGDSEALMRRIIEISLAHSVLCRFTAFVAVDRTERVNTAGTPHKVVQAVESPAGWGQAANGAARPEAAKRYAALAMPAEAAPAPMPAPAPPPPGAPPPIRAQAVAMPAAMPAGAPAAPPPPPSARPAQMARPAPASIAPATPAAPSKPRAPATPYPAKLEQAESMASLPAPELAPELAIDVTPYLARLDELRERLGRDLAAGVVDARARAGLLARALGELADDVESADGAADLVREVRAIAGALGSAADPLAGLRDALVSMERLLAQRGPGSGAGPAPSAGPGEGSADPSRRDSFWR
jgi:Ca-activated chloride channel family protein